jgi:hypothetical protein
MIKLKLESSWHEMIEMILEAEPQLTPEDVDFEEGEDEELVRKLAQKLNRSYEQITGWIESVSSTVNKAS